MAILQNFRIATLLVCVVSQVLAADDFPAATATPTQPRYTLRLPATAKYYPKDLEDLVQQYDSAHQNGVPKPIMKLFKGVDEGEKYYDFESYHHTIDRIPKGLFLPVNRHHSTHHEGAEGSQEAGWTPWVSPLKRLGKRQNAPACPSGNLACTNVQKPGYCCPTGSTCVNIQDTGFGSVGCCPSRSSKMENSVYGLNSKLSKMDRIVAIILTVVLRGMYEYMA